MGKFFIIGIAALVIGGMFYSAHLAAKRREAMSELARSLEMTFSPDRDHSMASQYQFLDKLAQGSNRYAYNVLRGMYRGHPVIVFDYHYETHSRDSKGNRKTSHHYFLFFILRFDANFPELVISREGFFSKIAQFFGYDDIDFESAEFSRKFVVRSPDKKFAYDIINARMIDYLLDNQDLQIEIDRDCLALFFGRCLAPPDIVPNLERLVCVRELFTDYVFADRGRAGY